MYFNVEHSDIVLNYAYNFIALTINYNRTIIMKHIVPYFELLESLNVRVEWYRKYLEYPVNIWILFRTKSPENFCQIYCKEAFSETCFNVFP